VEEAATSRNETARGLLAKNFPSTARVTKNVPGQAVRGPAKVPIDPVKLAHHQKVELIKMRHRAVPGDPKDRQASLPLDGRIHVKVTVDSKTERFFWFRKTIGTGKALDLLMSNLGISGDSCPVQLLKLSPTKAEEWTVCQNSEPLETQVEDGCTVMINPCTV